MEKEGTLPTKADHKDASFVQGLIWNGIWLFLNISMTLLNKSIFVHMDFPYPITISMIHMICTCIFSKLTINIWNYPVKTLNSTQHKSVGMDHFTIFLSPFINN